MTGESGSRPRGSGCQFSADRDRPVDVLREQGPRCGPQPAAGACPSRCATARAHHSGVGGELPGVRGSQGVAPASPLRRLGGALHGRAVDARAWPSRRGAGPAGENDDARGDARVSCGPGQPGVPGPAPERLVAGRPGAPRGAVEPCGGERPPPLARRSGPVEAGGSLTRGTPAKVEAALTTTGRASTVRWRGSGKRDGKVYVRNQRQKAPQDSHQLEPDRLGLGCNAHLTGLAGRETLWSVKVADREATVKDCGVAVARLQGHSWAPTPSKGLRVNVGTTSSVPAIVAGRPVAGRCRRSGAEDP